MRALTLHRHWAVAVEYYGKRLENRTKPPPRNLGPNEWIAIHAGLKGGSPADVAALSALAGYDATLDMDGTPAGTVVAVCRVVGWMSEEGQTWRWHHLRVHEKGPAITPVKTYLPKQAAALAEQRRWWQGPFGWLLADVQVLPEPVPARGALGLWRLPDDAERAVMAQMGVQP